MHLFDLRITVHFFRNYFVISDLHRASVIFSVTTFSYLCCTVYQSGVAQCIFSVITSSYLICVVLCIFAYYFLKSVLRSIMRLFGDSYMNYVISLFVSVVHKPTHLRGKMSPCDQTTTGFTVDQPPTRRPGDHHLRQDLTTLRCVSLFWTAFRWLSCSRFINLLILRWPIYFKPVSLSIFLTNIFTKWGFSPSSSLLLLITSVTSSVYMTCMHQLEGEC